MSIAIGAEFYAIDEANCDDVVSGLSSKNGKELWRERGHKEANVLRVGPEAILLRGDGRLTRCRLYRSGIEERNNYDLLKGRCWAAPTLMGDVLYARSEKEITAVRFSGTEKKEKIQRRTIDWPRSFKMLTRIWSARKPVSAIADSRIGERLLRSWLARRY